MKLPSQPDVRSHLLFDQRDWCLGPYPPKGFVLIENSDDGSGNHFGLYWPFGKESQEPMVCTMDHDSYSLLPVFSSLDRFAAAVRKYLDSPEDAPPQEELPPSLSHLIVTEEEEVGEPSDAESHWHLHDYLGSLPCPTPDEDPNSPLALLQKAVSALSENQVDLAVGTLRHVVRLLPEYTEAWAQLCIQHRRRREEELAAEAALMAMICPEWLGFVPPTVLQHFQRMKVPPSLDKDPFIKRRAQFRLKYGGEKTNNDYPLLQECIDEYLANGDPMKGILLHQKYASLMVHETVAFQERYGFSKEAFHAQQTEYFVRYLGDSRELPRPPVDTQAK